MAPASESRLVATRGGARVITSLVVRATIASPGSSSLSTTDAPWGPLFLAAGGVVVENGSTISHAGIVSCEFGVPKDSPVCAPWAYAFSIAARTFVHSIEQWGRVSDQHVPSTGKPDTSRPQHAGTR